MNRHVREIKLLRIERNSHLSRTGRNVDIPEEEKKEATNLFPQDMVENENENERRGMYK